MPFVERVRDVERDHQKRESDREHTVGKTLETRDVAPAPTKHRIRRRSLVEQVLANHDGTARLRA